MTFSQTSPLVLSLPSMVPNSPCLWPFTGYAFVLQHKRREEGRGATWGEEGHFEWTADQYYAPSSSEIVGKTDASWIWRAGHCGVSSVQPWTTWTVHRLFLLVDPGAQFKFCPVSRPIVTVWIYCLMTTTSCCSIWAGAGSTSYCSVSLGWGWFLIIMICS